MSIQSVRTLSTSTYQSFSAYMTVRQQKVATVALLILGCLVTLFVCYWHYRSTKKKEEQVNVVENDVENQGAQAQVNNVWQGQLAKMEKQHQKIKDLAEENQRLQLNLQRMLNTPIEDLLNNPVLNKPAAAPVPAPVPDPMVPAPVFNAIPPRAAAPALVNVVPPQAAAPALVKVIPPPIVAVPAPKENFPTLPELLAYVDTAINHLSDLEKSMNQRGVATDQVGLADIIAEYNTQIKPTLVHPIEGADDVQRLKWKDTLNAFSEAKRKLLFSMAVDGKMVHDKNNNEIHLMSNFSKSRNPLYHCLAEGYYLAGRYKEAVEMVDKIVHSREVQDNFFIKIADSYYQQDQLKEATEVLGKIVDDKTAKEKSYVKIAEAYCEKDQLKEATEVLGKIVVDKTAKEKGYVKIAEAYCKKDQLKEATEVLGKIVVDKTAKEKGYVRIADACYKAGNRKDALEVISKISTNVKLKDDFYIKVAEDDYRKGNRKEALEAIRKVSLDYNAKQAFIKKCK